MEKISLQNVTETKYLRHRGARPARIDHIGYGPAAAAFVAS